MSFDKERFELKLKRALSRVKKILHVNRNPLKAEEVDHQYEDKYELAEFLTNSALAAQLNVLRELGVSEEHMQQLKCWSLDRTVTLRLAAEETCVFDRKEERKVEHTTREASSNILGRHSVKEKVVTLVEEWFWNFSVRYQLIAYAGSDPKHEPIVIRTAADACVLKTTVDKTPMPKEAVHEPIEVDVSWMLSQLTDELGLSFSIDRDAPTCHTPRRNADVDAARRSLAHFRMWANRVHKYFAEHLFPVDQGHYTHTNLLLDASSMFVPVVALFEQQAARQVSSVVLSGADLNEFLAEQQRSIRAHYGSIRGHFNTRGVKTAHSGELCSTMDHVKELQEVYFDGVDYIEEMLRRQLIGAIGKEVTTEDFTDYMRFHNRKLYREQYQPQPFMYSIRRPMHYPEGVLSIEESLESGGLPRPIVTSVRSSTNGRPMHFPISASSSVTFHGERHLHGWISHSFSGATGSTVQLVARARQFSSFMLVVGKIAGAELFEPKHAVILENKDEVMVPLLMEPIPTPKEFADAIESLSPEQQRFAKAFRSMQLESTLFGVVVIQIKPQLEKLLNLPDDSLTKEIQLTQDLMELFIKYQIPSDLLTFSGDEAASADERVATVKAYVAEMQAMIQKVKDEELAEQLQKQRMEALQMMPPPAPPAPIPYFSPMMDMGPPPPVPPAYCCPPPACGGAGPPPPAPPPAAGGGPAPPPPPAPTIAPPPAPTPAPVSTEAVASEPAVEEASKGAAEVEEAAEGEGEDVTQLPVEIDAKLLELDEDSAVRPTIIKAANEWKKKHADGLLADLKEVHLGKDQLQQERNAAFDLLDSITRSGVLAIDAAALHVVVAATHCFDKTLLETVVQDNMNPIEKVERSSLIIASSVQRVPVEELVRSSELGRVKTYSSILFNNH